MTIREFINNPMGKGDASIPNRKELAESLDMKYQRLIRNKGNSIRMVIYKSNNKTDDIYYHLVIPSETERTNSYDVVFKFSDTKKEHKNELSVANYDIAVFSNSPSFAYTFAHVYMENGLFVNSLKRKLDKDIVKKEPEIRNKYGIVNYEKYVYFGARFIIDSKKMNRAFLDTSAVKYSQEVLNSRIRSLEVILAEYRRAATKLTHKKKQESKRQMQGKSVIPKSSIGKEIKKKTPKRKMGKIKKL